MFNAIEPKWISVKAVGGQLLACLPPRFGRGSRNYSTFEKQSSKRNGLLRIARLKIIVCCGIGDRVLVPHFIYTKTAPPMAAYRVWARRHLAFRWPCSGPKRKPWRKILSCMFISSFFTLSFGVRIVLVVSSSSPPPVPTCHNTQTAQAVASRKTHDPN